MTRVVTSPSAVERALVAPQVVGEDRLPDLRAQPRRRQRAADDRAEGEVEGAPDLEEAGEEVRRQSTASSGDRREDALSASPGRSRTPRAAPRLRVRDEERSAPGSGRRGVEDQVAVEPQLLPRRRALPASRPCSESASSSALRRDAAAGSGSTASPRSQCQTTSNGVNASPSACRSRSRRSGVNGIASRPSRRDRLGQGSLAVERACVRRTWDARVTLHQSVGCKGKGPTGVQAT